MQYQRSHTAGIVLSLVFILCSLNQLAAGNTYYITATSTDLCTGRKSCLTLSQFAANSSDYLQSNNTLVFLPGTHYLNEVNLSVSSVDNFVMKSDTVNSTVNIMCTNHSYMHFNQSKCIHILNLEFIGCGNNQITFVQELVIQSTAFIGHDNSGTALELIEITALIFNSNFTNNAIGSYRKCLHPIYSYGCHSGFVGGAIIATNSMININQTTFEYNGADFGGTIFAEQQSVINISHSTFTHNHANCGGVLYSNSSSITIVKSNKFHTNSAIFKGGVLSSSQSDITLEASEFYGNYAYDGGVVDSYGSTIAIEECKFHKNSASFSGVLTSYMSTIIMEECEFNENTATEKGGVSMFHNSTVTLRASKFFNNYSYIYTGGAVHFTKTNITIEASVFHNHYATMDEGVLI